jgi:hypothetical protein
MELYRPFKFSIAHSIGMPRTRMDELHALAEEHDGLLTSKEARALGIQDSVLVRFAQRGRLERMSRGSIASLTTQQTGSPSIAKRCYGHKQAIMGRSALLCPMRRHYSSMASQTWILLVCISPCQSRHGSAANARNGSRFIGPTSRRRRLGNMKGFQSRR